MTSILSRLTAGDQWGPYLLDEIDAMKSVECLRGLYDEITLEIGRLSDRDGLYPRWPFEEDVTAEGPTTKEAQRGTRAVFFMLYYHPRRREPARASAEFRNAFDRLIQVGDDFKRRVFEEVMRNAREGQNQRRRGKRAAEAHGQLNVDRNEEWLRRKEALIADGERAFVKVLQEQLKAEGHLICRSGLMKALQNAEEKRESNDPS